MAFKPELLSKPATQQIASKLAINLSVGIGHLTNAITALEKGDKEALAKYLSEARDLAKEMTAFFDELTGYTDDDERR